MRRARTWLICVSGLVIAILLLWYWVFVQESYSPVTVALRAASRSQEIQKALGQPITKRYVTGRIISGTDYGNADLTIHVAGPAGKGILSEWAQNGFAGWHICSLVFVDEAGHDLVLVDDSTTTCERE